MTIQELPAIPLKKEKSYSRDERLLFLEFTARKTAKLLLWGQELPLSLTIAPKAYPLTMRAVKLSPSRQGICDRCMKAKTKIESMLLAPPNEADYLTCCRVDTMEEHLHKIALSWQSDEPVSQRIKAVNEQMTALHKTLTDLTLPAELNRIDSRLGGFLKTLDEQIGQMAVVISEEDCDFPPAFDALWERARRLIFEMEEGYGLLAGAPRLMTPAERQEKDALDTAFAYSLDTDERLGHLERLWSNELLSPLARLVYVRRTIQMLDKLAKKPYESPAWSRPEAHLAQVQKALETAASQGLSYWKQQMACAFITCAKDWAPDGTDLDAITAETFADDIIPCEVAVETHETEHTIVAVLTLGFRDANDYLAGHTMYAVNRDAAQSAQPVEFHL